MSESFSLFPTLIMKFDLLDNMERDQIFQVLKTLDSEPHDAITNGLSSHSTQFNIIKYFNLEKRIQNKLDEYTSKIQIQPVSITNSWFNIQDIGGILKTHNHANSVLSIALYINVDNDSSYLYFDNPNPHVYANWLNTGGTEYNYQYYFFRPKNGEMYVFPSWLRHGSKYTANQTKDRTVISSNTQYR